MRLVLVLCTIALLVGAVYSRVSRSPINNQRHEDIVAFWTKERMASAVPVHIDISERDGFVLQEEEENEQQGEPRFIPGYYNGEEFDGIDMHQMILKGNWRTRDLPLPFTTGYVSNYTIFPYCTMGKIFAVSGDKFEVCSGAVVGENIIFTAGHCVFNEKGWAQQFSFFPAYDDDSRPYGPFTAYQLMAPYNYTHGEGPVDDHRGYDIGIAILNRFENKTVRETVGSLPVAFNLGYNDSDWVSYGYPAAEPFNGQTNYFCIGESVRIDQHYMPNPIGMGCNATQGSSGGPRLVNLLNQTSYLNSVNGFNYKNQSILYGSYFGPAAEELFNEANSVVPPS